MLLPIHHLWAQGRRAAATGHELPNRGAGNNLLPDSRALAKQRAVPPALRFLSVPVGMCTLELQPQMAVTRTAQEAPKH